MDFGTRDQYRYAIERIEKRSPLTQQAVACFAEIGSGIQTSRVVSDLKRGVLINNKQCQPFSVGGLLLAGIDLPANSLAKR